MMNQLKSERLITKLVNNIISYALMTIFLLTYSPKNYTQNKLDIKFGVVEQDGFNSEGKFHIVATDRYCKLDMYDKNQSNPVSMFHSLIGVKKVYYSEDSTVVTYSGNGKYVFSKDSLRKYTCTVYDNYGNIKKKYSKEMDFAVIEPKLIPQLDRTCNYLQNASKGFLIVGENNLRYELSGISSENLVMNCSAGKLNNMLGAAILILDKIGEVVVSIHIENSNELVYEKVYKVLPKEIKCIIPDSNSCQNKCAFISESRSNSLVKNSINFLEVEFVDYYKEKCDIKVEGAECFGFDDKGFLRIKTTTISKVKISFYEKSSGNLWSSSDWLVE